MQTGREINYKDRVYNREMAEAGLSSIDRQRAATPEVDVRYAKVARNYCNLISDGIAESSCISNALTNGMAVRGVGGGELGLAAPVLYSRFDGSNGQASYTAESGQVFTFFGNAQLDTSTKKFGASSLKLDGTTDYVTLPNSSDWDFGTGDFTIDFWVRFNVAPAPGVAVMIYMQYQDGSHYVNFYLANVAGQMQWTWGISLGQYHVNYTSIAAGRWYHVALVRYNATWFVFQDGQLLEATTYAGTSSTSVTGTLYIGADNAGANALNGWLDEFRITKGYARWIGHYNDFGSHNKDFAYALPISQYDHSKGSLMSDVFKAPTDVEMVGLALRVDDSANLLIRGDNGDGLGLIRDVAANKAVTLVGGVSIDSAVTKFGKGAMRFDGTTGYLTIPDTADLELGAGNFTIDCWVKLNVLPAEGIYQVIACHWDGPANQRSWMLGYYRTGGLYYWMFRISTNGTSSSDQGWADTVSAGIWYHIAIVRISNVLYGFRDGVKGLIVDMTGKTFFDSSAVVDIGAVVDSGTPNSFWNGWIDEFVISKGVSKYLNDFEPPTAPYGINQLSAYIAKDADPYRVLSLQFEGADASTTIVDDCSHTVTAVNSAQLDTAQKKWGVSSCLFNLSTLDYLTIPDSDEWELGNVWTIDFWVRFNSYPISGSTFMSIVAHSSVTYAGWWIDFANYSGTYRWRMNQDDANIFMFDSPGISLNTWYHIAYVRESESVWKVYQDGILIGTYTTATALTATAEPLIIGRRGNAPPSPNPDYLDGWLDNLVIRKGVAKWTSNFTPPDNLNHFVKVPLIQEDNSQNIFQGGAVYRSLEMIDLGARADTQKRDLAYRLDLKNGSTMKVKGISTHWR
jgi:hypothetical protein